jgi:hypothetical protein
MAHRSSSPPIAKLRRPVDDDLQTRRAKALTSGAGGDFQPSLALSSLRFER